MEKTNTHPKALDRNQAFVITAFTGILAMPFEDYHLEAERFLKRQILTHEFISLGKELKEAVRADFVAMTYR